MERGIGIVAMLAHVAQLVEHGMDVNYFQNDVNVAGIHKMKELGITEGDFV